jgi:hypothetical protein
MRSLPARQTSLSRFLFQKRVQTMRDHMSFPRSYFLALLVPVFLLCSSGCGGSERVVSVSGTVTHMGKPVPGLVISFVPVLPTETGVSTGETDDNGKYDLTVVKTGSSGAVIGNHKVWVSLPREPYVEPSDKEETAKLNKLKKQATRATAKPPADVADILKKYGNLDKSPLTVEVKGGAPMDFKLD